MKIFIGRIPNELRSDEVREFFETFGEVADFNFKGTYAFVEFRDEGVARRVLENRDYNIREHSVFVEESIGRKRHNDDFGRRPPAGGYDDYGRRPAYDQPPYDPYRRDPYNDRPMPAYYDDRRGPEPYGRGRPYDPRDDCPHCSRCEVHGTVPRRGGYGEYDRPKRPKRDHPNDVNKLVIECLPHNVSVCGVEDFVRGEGYDVVFCRLTSRGDSAIVELRDISSKEDALNKLQGKEINGTRINVRNFKTGVSSGFSERQEDSHGGVDLYGGIDSVNVD